MESTGRDGRRGPWNYYLKETGSNSYTSSSGTVSTGYSASTGSQLSWRFMEVARHFQEMEMEDPVSMEMEEAVMDLEFVQSPKETASGEKIQEMEADRQIQEMEMNKAVEFVPSLTKKATKMKQIKILAKEFFGAPSGKCSAEGGDLNVLERWFTELGVRWVLHVADGAPAGEFKHALDASRWIPALTEIVDTFRLITSRFLPSRDSAEEEELATESDEEQNMAEHLQLASFTQQAMLKMLTFVDFIVAPNLTRQVFITNSVPAHTHRHHIYNKLHNLLRVHEAMSKLAWIKIRLVSSSSAEVATILREIVDVLSAKEDMVGEAIWSALEEIRTRLLESPEDVQGSSGTQAPQGSSDIDKATRSVMVYVMFLQHNYWLLTPVVSEAASLGKYVPRFGAVQPVTSLAMETISFLEEKLANKSEASPDQGLRFLFLLNNSSFIADQLHDTPYFPKSYKEDLAGKAEDYMKRYMQKMYNTQKLWKVPDPKLRSRLRRAIIDEVIPGYKRYVGDDNRNVPLKFSPSNLQEMLQELFEG
ncbi:hypothetical protein PVAP13_7KG116700 [Panicum virgatum]|uniref:Exocyst subunit Exo70 family protein n=1 Tax=Panicum virgatum TaxID=38727 RepID=A0A8T0QGL2_PANVG|nr:hypothetical protein PVAP13_7KG116700 [Panicum virgatum]